MLKANTSLTMVKFEELSFVKIKFLSAIYSKHSFSTSTIES